MGSGIGPKATRPMTNSAYPRDTLARLVQIVLVIPSAMHGVLIAGDIPRKQKLIQISTEVRC
jgi:hypothetical protein